MKRAILVTGLALGIAATACSSSSKKSDASASSTAAPVVTSASSGTYTGDKNSQFCRLGAEFSTRFSNLNASLSGGADKARTEISTLKDVIGQAKAAAPQAVKGDVDTLAGAFDQFFSEAEGANFDPQALASAGSKLVNSNVQTAAQHLQAYGQQVCGLDTSGSTP
jgi:hypothetical protein